MLLTNKDDENDSTLWSIVHKPDYLKFRFIRSKVDECANDRRSIRFYCELSESCLDFYHKPAKTALRKLTKNVSFRVPSAGWRIREIPDCASSPKTHKYNTENEKWNQIKSSRAISKSCAIPGCPWRLAAMMPCW